MIKILIKINFIFYKSSNDNINIIYLSELNFFFNLMIFI